MKILADYRRMVAYNVRIQIKPDGLGVVSGGRGVGPEQEFKVIFDSADKLGDAVGASHAAVDAGHAPNELRAGQTGKTIAPELCVAIGISGARHSAGIEDAGTIVAINEGPEAPAFEVGDTGLVGGPFKVLPVLEQAL